MLESAGEEAIEVIRARLGEHDRRLATLAEQVAIGQAAISRMTSMILELQAENRSSYRTVIEVLQDIQGRLSSGAPTVIISREKGPHP